MKKNKKTSKNLPKSSGKLKSDVAKTTHTTAKTEDGSMQINFTVPFEIIDNERTKTIVELSETLEIPGFRKGKAPLSESIKHIPQDRIIQNTLSKILPDLLAEVITTDKLRLAMYPRFELLKAVDGEPWEVSAITCELPKIDLGSYKKAIRGTSKSDAIWTPEMGDPKEKDNHEPAQAKEQRALELLLKEVDVKVPHILIDEEANAKLSQLLDRIEKLGLNFESYLRSINKTPETLRGEYETQAESAIKIDLILSEIAREEKLSVEESQIEAAISASSIDPVMAKNAENEQQKRIIESILLKRKALEYVISLM